MAELKNCVHQTNIGERIRFLREAAGIKQWKLADACCVSPSTMSKYENGTRRVPNEVLELIFDLFSIDSTAFYTNDDFLVIARVVKNRTTIFLLPK